MARRVDQRARKAGGSRTGPPRESALARSAGIASDDRRCLGPIKRGGKQVAGRQTAVRPPFLGDGENLLLGRKMVQLISGLDSLTERKIAGQNDVFSV
jgi:hypothetical protein